MVLLASPCCECVVVLLWLLAAMVQVQGVNGLVSRWGYLGLAATADGRQLRDVAGQQLQVGT
jgi:hypothetical protein